MEAAVLVPPQGNNLEGTTHPRSLECDSGQAFPTQSSHSNRVVTISTNVQSFVFHMGPSTNGLVCHLVQSQTPSVTGPGSDSLGGRCSQSAMGELGRVRFPTSVPDSPGDSQNDGSGLSQNDSHCPRVAKHALVLGPGEFISSDSPQSASGKGPVQRTSSEEPQQSESACLAPRVYAIRKQGFSDEVAERIEAPQRGSTRAVYKSKWAIFVKWCGSHEVDYRSPSVNQIADFLLHLFTERNLQPSTIEGYRTAIADMVGNDKLNISKDEHLTRLLDSFHRDKPKGRRGVASWNLSLVLYQLTKAPFEPLRKASLKHLTFKTLFLLALGSGKRRDPCLAIQKHQASRKLESGLSLPVSLFSLQKSTS